MQAIAETVFDIIYLTLVITVGIQMILKSHGNKQYKLFGIMAVTLGAGDAFHLIPRAVALCTTGLDSFTAALGIGKWITSITMTIFYVLLYYVWRIRYKIQGNNSITRVVYLLAAARIALCMFPQNAWTQADAPLSWGIYRQHSVCLCWDCSSSFCFTEVQNKTKTALLPGCGFPLYSALDSISLWCFGQTASH